MLIEQWPIERVIPYARNARTITPAAVDKVAASIQEFGWRQPIVVDAQRVIIAGHTRLLAARKLNLTEVPVHVADNLTPAQVKAYRLMDNRSHDETSWDFELLGPELLDLQNLGYGNLELTGFDEQEIADFLAGASSPGQEGLTPDDDAPSLRDAPVAQPGELWVLGPHRLLCGDATVPADLKRVLAGSRADLVIIDPPYNVNYEGATKAKLKIKGDNMADAAFYTFLLATYRNLASVTKEGAGIYVFHADTEGMNFRRALVEGGWKLAQCCVWVKQTLVMGRQDYHWQHEPILYGWKPGASHRWFTDRKQTTVWNFDKPARPDRVLPGAKAGVLVGFELPLPIAKVFLGHLETLAEAAGVVYRFVVAFFVFHDQGGDSEVGIAEDLNREARRGCCALCSVGVFHGITIHH